MRENQIQGQLKKRVLCSSGQVQKLVRTQVRVTGHQREGLDQFVLPLHFGPLLLHRWTDSRVYVHSNIILGIR